MASGHPRLAGLTLLVCIACRPLWAGERGDPAMERMSPPQTLPTTSPSTMPVYPASHPMGKLALVCPHGVLAEMRHGSELFMFFRGGRVIAVAPDFQKPEGADRMVRLVTAGVDILPDPNQESSGDVFPLADGTVSDVLSEDTEHEYRGLGYSVIVRHSEKLLGREAYSLYSHLRDEPKVAVGDPVIAGKTSLGRIPEGDPGIGLRLHTEVRFFRERYYIPWKAPSGVRGKNFVARDFQRDFIDPALFFAVVHPDVPALINALKDKEPAARQEATECLGLLGTQAADGRAALAETTNDAESEVAGAAAAALVRTYGSGDQATKDVAGLLKHPSDFVRSAAAMELGELGTEAADVAVPALIAALEDVDHSVRGHVAAALSQYAPGAKQAIAPLRKALKEDGAPEVQSGAARSLAAFGPEARDAIPDVLEILPSLDPAARATVIRALPRFGPDAKIATPVLQNMQSDPDDQVRAAVKDVLKQLMPTS